MFFSFYYYYNFLIDCIAKSLLILCDTKRMYLMFQAYFGQLAF